MFSIMGTINHPNVKNMSKRELQESKRAARFWVLMQAMVIVVSVYLKVDLLYIGYMKEMDLRLFY